MKSVFEPIRPKMEIKRVNEFNLTLF
jgi:hypothetical protein